MRAVNFPNFFLGVWSGEWPAAREDDSAVGRGKNATLGRRSRSRCRPPPGPSPPRARPGGSPGGSGLAAAAAAAGERRESRLQRLASSTAWRRGSRPPGPPRGWGRPGLGAGKGLARPGPRGYPRAPSQVLAALGRNGTRQAVAGRLGHLGAASHGARAKPGALRRWDARREWCMQRARTHRFMDLWKVF